MKFVSVEDVAFFSIDDVYADNKYLSVVDHVGVFEEVLYVSLSPCAGKEVKNDDVANEDGSGDRIAPVSHGGREWGVKVETAVWPGSSTET